MDDPWRAAATAGTRAQGRLQGPTCQAQGQEQKEEEVSSITRYDADQIAAGDTIVIKEGKIRRFYHVCEVSISGATFTSSITTAAPGSPTCT
jgi:hypothetical protein